MFNTKFAIPMLPDLVEIQRSSFCWFLEEGLAEEIIGFSPISYRAKNLELHFLGDQYKLKYPKYNIVESKRRGITYSTYIYIPTRLINTKTGIIKEQEVFIGELPLMTDRGTFIINGIERVVINQIVRSPGIYYTVETDKRGRRNYSGNLISNRGSWIKFDTDKNDLIWVRIDKTRKMPVHVFLKAMGLSDADIYRGLRHPEYLKKTFRAEGNYTVEESLLQIHSVLHPGEPPTIAGGQELLYSRFFDPKRYDLGKVGRYKLNKKLNLTVPETIKVLTPQDTIAAIDYLINLKFDLGEIDDIDHLGNRRVRSVGELLQNQIRLGLNRLEKIIKDRMRICDADSVVPTMLINPNPIISSIREFFCSSQLSQFMDQTNPLAELTHKRRISALGPGGLNRDRAGFVVRDIHPSHYGRICPIETPEGPNAGLVNVLSTYALVNYYGFLETPFYKVINGREIVESEDMYLTADQEDELKIAPGDIATDLEGYLQGENIPTRYKQEFTTSLSKDIDCKAISPIQMMSIATSLIPFVEHDDANRALMGANMQRQAVPLLHPERPLIGTGLEAQIARDSGMVIVNIYEGIVSYVSADSICITNTDGKETVYYLQKYQRSNQDTCMHQRPLVWLHEKVISGQIIADGAATDGGELALGQNILVAYMPWEGYNYEDAFLISERLVYTDAYTSIHIEEHEIKARQTKMGPEEVTKNIPTRNIDLLQKLDDNGIIMIGSWVEYGEVLVGKVTPKGEQDQSPEIRLLRAIFGEKVRDVKDDSLRVPRGGKGRVLDVRVFTKENGDDLSPGVNLVIKVYIAQSRKIQIGDKMAGRHGNKGVISKILPIEDMPYLPDGTPVDIVLNPLGVPSRMNVGQLFECLLGLAADKLNKRYNVIPFDEMHGAEASRILVNSSLINAKEITNKEWIFNIKHPGKVTLSDGRTGEKFENPITVGMSYMLKLVHLVDDKIHARSTGPYSLVTQQPLGGKAQHGGQRLGEMEVWALEAFGVAYTLQELLTIKSDDMQGRNETLRAIVKGRLIPIPGIPESFKVLMRELHSLALDIGAYRVDKLANGQTRVFEIDLMPSSSAEKPVSSTK